MTREIWRRSVLLMKHNMPVIATCLAALVLVYLLKDFYSNATCTELKWMLRPLALLVGLLKGVAFSFESGEGYVSPDHAVVIAKSCSGINFLIIAFSVSIMVIVLRANTGSWVLVLALPAAAVFAYAVSLIVNAGRIMLSIELYAGNYQWGSLTPQRLHFTVGVIVYFLAAYLLFCLVNKLCDFWQSGCNCRRGVLLSNWLVPLAAYLAVTVMLPFLNGACRLGGEQFIEYCIITVSIPVIICIVLPKGRNHVSALLQEKTRGPLFPRI